MNFLKVAKDDISSILKNRFIRVSIIAIIVVPLLYSLLYLYAFWDPYSKLEDLNIAVVNKDIGTVMNGEEVNYGKDFEDELRSNNEIGWVFTSEEDANEGLEGTKYYAKVIIPEDFSKKVISAKDGKPEVAKIEFITNDKKNFLASQINSKVEVELKSKLNSKISGNYIEVAFDSLYEAKDGLVQAADGSNKLYDGLSTLNEKVPELSDGVNKLSDGSSQLVNGQVTLNEGIDKLSQGSSALTEGLSELYNKVPSLSNGVSALDKGTNELKNGIDSAASGSNLLADGSSNLYSAYTGKVVPAVEALKNGANQLNSSLEAGRENISKLSQGSTLISNSSDEVSNGYTAIDNGINTLILGVTESSNANLTVEQLLNQANSTEDINVKNQLITKALEITTAINEKSKESQAALTALAEGSNKFKSSLNQYTEGAKSLANGTNTLINSVSQVQGGVSSISTGLNTLYSSLEPSSSEFGQGLKAIADNTKNLNDGLNKLYAGANKINQGTQALSSSIPSLESGVTQLYNGSKELNNGTNQLASGSNKLLDGQKELNNGVETLTSAVPELSDGVNKLYDGSKELATKLDEGAEKIENGLVNSAKDMGEFGSQAVDMKFEAINSIPNYGTGFAPYFIPLSLWIGAIMMFFIISPKVKDEENLSKFDKTVGKYLSYSFVGVLQALLVSFVVVLLGLQTTNIVAYVLMNIFLSLVFIAIIQCLISLLGDAGRLLAIVLLILQLTACAGTFPLEVVPRFFKVLNPFMPFTYAVEALREVISSDVISYSILGKDIAILAGILIVFLTISITLRNVGEKISAKIEGRKEAVEM